MFATLTANSGYWLTEVEKGSLEKAAFTSDIDLYHFVRSFFGIKNAPETF